MPRAGRVITIGALPLLALGGCDFVLDGYTGGALPSTDAGVDGNVPTPIDADVTYASCKEAHTLAPTAPSGTYRLRRDGGTRDVYCDMVNDDGGWMLVTRDMLTDEQSQNVEVQYTADTNGGVAMVLRATNEACGGPDASPNGYTMFVDESITRWTQIRAKWSFFGTSSCWKVFGSPNTLVFGNLVAFDKTQDAIRDQVGMGGASAGIAVDSFDGIVERCDNLEANFWLRNGTTERSAVVTLRHGFVDAPAGLSTLAACVKTNGTSGWSYRDIYVR